MNRLVALTRAALVAALSLAAADAHGQAPRPAAPTAAELPATAAGRLARTLLDAVASADTGAIARMLDATLSPAAQQPRAEIEAYLRAFRDEAGGVTVGTTRVTQRGNLVAQLWANRHPAGVEFVVFPDPADSTRLLRVDVNRSLRPDGDLRPFPREQMDDAAIVRVLETELRRLADADQLSGTVVVARGGDILFQGTYGWETPGGARMTTRSRFHLASMGKMFTAVAVARLVEQGRLSLDHRVGDLLPGQPWSEQARAITVRQLLSHTSGLGALFDRPGYVWGRIYRTATERLSLFASEPLLFAPGERFSYSNEGYETLGAIVESITGRPFNEHIRDDVLLRAGMATALPDAPADSLTDRTMPSPHGEGDLFGVGQRVERSLGWNAGGAGGGHASAEDLFRFARALVDGRLVSRSMLDTLITPRADMGGSSRYAYGFMPREVNGRTVFGHGGGGPLGFGICTDLDAFADGSWTVVVLTNYDAPFCSELKREITEMLARN